MDLSNPLLTVANNLIIHRKRLLKSIESINEVPVTEKVDITFQSYRQKTDGQPANLWKMNHDKYDKLRVTINSANYITNNQ